MPINSPLITVPTTRPRSCSAASDDDIATTIWATTAARTSSSASTFPIPSRPLVRHHHERFDDHRLSGRPVGRPTSSSERRSSAIAEAYDAMTAAALVSSHDHAGTPRSSALASKSGRIRPGPREASRTALLIRAAPGTTAGSEDAREEARRGREEPPKTSPIASNRKAFHDYFIEDRTEAGLVLTRHGGQVPPRRTGAVERLLRPVPGRRGVPGRCPHLALRLGVLDEPPPERDRKLLLHNAGSSTGGPGRSRRTGVACVPLSLYFKGSRAKAEIALVKGKKLHDKRDAIRDRDLKREADRAMRRR